MVPASRLAYTVLDGTLVPIDRLADQKRYYFGKHKRHGMNVQVLAIPPAGWCAALLPFPVRCTT